MHSSFDLSDYKWSSYKEYTSETRMTDTKYIMDLFSDNPKDAIELFKKYLEEENKDTCLEIVKKKPIITDDMLRQIIKKHIRLVQ